MKLNINIPTKGRPQKLKECIESIDYTGEYDIYIHCYSAVEDLPKDLPPRNYIIHEDKTILTIESHNRTCKNEGHFLGLSDDIKFHTGAIDMAVDMLENEAEGFGIVDFIVANMDSPDGCYMLLSERYIDAFPDRTPYCPEYRFMFASAELRDYTKKIGRFFRCDSASLDHYHPTVTGKPDATHNRIRSQGIIGNDQRIYEKRQIGGKLWCHKQEG